MPPLLKTSADVPRRVGLLGQCFFTWQLAKHLCEQGCRPHIIVIDLRDMPDADPFPGLTGAEDEAWYKRHQLYHTGWRHELKQLCHRHGIPLQWSLDPFTEFEGCDTLVVAGFGRKVPNPVLTRFGDWALNMHPSMLPAFAGPQPEAHMILQGNRNAGISLHTMTDIFDRGPLRAQAPYDILPEEDLYDLEQKAATKGATLLKTLLSSTTLPILARENKQESYHPAYDPLVTLDLARCGDTDRVLRTLRLRPEGYAFLKTGPNRIYPIRCRSVSSPDQPQIHTPNGSLSVCAYVQCDPFGNQTWVDGAATTRE